MKTNVAAVVAAALLASMPFAARAQEAQELKLSLVSPPTSVTWTQGWQKWVERIEKDGEGTVKIKPYVVAEIPGFIFLGQVYLAPVIDRVSLRIGDDFDERSFGVRLVCSWLEHDRQFVRLQHHQAADGDDADTVYEKLEQHRVKSLARL